MQRIGTLSLTQHVKDWLESSSHPRILHVFDRVCNLINERHEVLSIVTPEIGNGPFNLVLEDIVLFSRDLNVETPVSIASNQLKLGDFIIHIANADLWNPHPDWEQLHNDRDHIANQLNIIPVPDLQLPNPPTSKLAFSIAKANISAAKFAASKLAGLGVGLTPSGDDFIMGAVYALWIIHPPNVAYILAQEISSIATPLTTSLSAEWLRAAGRAEASILWHEFLDALISSEPIVIQSSVDAILAVGATSGADALAGFIVTLMAYRELEKKHVISKFI